MAYPYYYGRRPKPAPKPAPLPPAVSGLRELREQFENRPYGSHGEVLVASPTPPTPPMHTPRVQIPEPDWEAEALERGQRDAAEPEPPQPLYPGAALEQLKRQIGDETEPKYKIGPALEYAPVERFQPQLVDWEEEERRAAAETKRAELERARRILAESEKT